jgi:hypothetical protein
MTTVSDRTADLMVDALQAEANRLHTLQRHRDLAGPQNIEARKRLRAHERECHVAISAINTGEGVARRDV